MNNKYALVSGASRGLGYEYCKNLLELGYNIIAVSRNTSNLSHLATIYPKQDIVTFNYDLSNIANCYELINEVDKYNVSVVINNAGYGISGKFDEIDFSVDDNLIDLNIKSLQLLTKHFVKKFKKQNEGRIINISSIAAFCPGPLFGTYYASKAYVHNLSFAINYELRKEKSQVRVITIAPGPLKTSFWQRSTNNRITNLKNKFGPKPYPLKKFAKKSLHKALKTNKKNIIVLGFSNKMIRFFTNFIPKNWAMKSVYTYMKKNVD